ncbi:hypothetical protein [Mycobacterium dioxanotrophicus]|uniref:hypothetical protein n=1 Tax=Mycobacterium dioxanotrophicus TaxID=482462 RepID=UPI0012FA1C0B|nr:hypothetical protein [Mycobacterium dioxanotrophicus]
MRGGISSPRRQLPWNRTMHERTARRLVLATTLLCAAVLAGTAIGENPCLAGLIADLVVR